MTRDEKFLLDLGGSVSMKGFHYIIKGLELARENPDLIQAVVKSFYPEVARHYPGVTPPQVEKCIRQQIISIYRKAIQLPPELELSNTKSKYMTNKEFMARLLKMTENPSET